MKKALVILMTVAMMFCFSATAFAANFSDMDNASSTVKDAVNKAVALEIIEGYEDGTFKPDATITRAEFAKMACIAAGLKSSGEALSGTTPSFSDVKANEWYTGWINLASSKGFVRGYEDGTYKPNQTISNQEIVTVLMRMLGYNDNLTGPWPIDYINQAAKLDVTEDITGFVGAAAATRGNVAVMLDATLDQNMVEYSKDIEDFQEKTKTMRDYQATGFDEDGKAIQWGYVNVERAYTLLEDSFDGYVADMGAGAGSVTLKNAEKQTMNLDYVGGTMEIGLDTAFSGDNTLFGLKNMEGEVIYTVDKDDVKHAKFVDITSTKIKTDDVKKGDNGRVKVDGRQYNLASGVDYNEDIASVIEEGCNVEFTVYVNEDNQVYMVTTDIKEDMVKESQIIEEVDADKDEVDFLNGKSGIEIDPLDSLIIKDGKFVAVDDLKAGEVLTQRDGENIYEVTAAKTGKLSRYADKQYATIDGTRYPMDGFKLYDGDYEDITGDIQDYVGEEITFVLNNDNTISTAVSGAEVSSSTMYGVITKVTLNDGNNGQKTNEIAEATIFNQEGKSVKYDIKSELLGLADAADDSVDCDVDVKVGDPIEFKLDADGVIKSVNTIADGQHDYIDGDGKDTFATDDDDKTIAIGGTDYTVRDDAYIFNVDEDGSNYDVSLVSASALLDGKDATTQQVHTQNYFYAKLDGSKVKVIFATGLNATSDIKYGFIDDIGFSNADNDENVLFYGNETEYELDSASKTANPDDLVMYQLDGDTAKILKVITNEANVKVKDIVGSRIYFYDAEAIKVDDNGDAVEDTITSVKTTDSTVYYIYDGDIDANASLSDLDTVNEDEAENALIYANEDNEALVVVIFE